MSFDGTDCVVRRLAVLPAAGLLTGRLTLTGGGGEVPAG